jgi:ribonuclease BN (tRNA processing enzyme)
VPFHKARADVAFRELHDGAHFEINDVVVSCTRLNHPYIATAYALSADGAKVAYIADTAPFSDILFGHEFLAGPPSPHSLLSKSDHKTLRTMRSQVVRLCEGADLVIYDTMFTPEEYRQTPHFGHSRPSDAVDICHDAGARMLALYHHAPDRSDTEVDAVLASTRKEATLTARKLEIIAGFEGLDLALGKQG